MSWPTKAHSRFAGDNWEAEFKGKLSEGAEGDAYTPSERLRVLAGATVPDSLRKAARDFAERVVPVEPDCF